MLSAEVPLHNELALKKVSKHRVIAALVKVLIQRAPASVSYTYAFAAADVVAKHTAVCVPSLTTL